MKEASKRLLEWSTDTAKERGLLNRFVYMNFASNQQSVLEGLGPENLSRMKKIKQKYDPERLLDLWRGGYKL